MEQIDRINNIIQPFLDEKGNYDYLKPINLVERQFKVDRKFGFYPTGGSKEEYDAPPEFKDESERLEFIKILNTDIRAYNKWAGDRPQYPNIDEFPEYSFLVVRDGDPYVDKRLYIEIHDELLYEHIQDEDFVPRFNRTIYEYLISKKESAQAEDRWDEKNIWHTPYRNFGDWFDRHPQYGDAKPYSFKSKSEDDIEREKRNLKIFNYIADGLKKNRQRKNLISEMATENNISFTTVRDIYYEMDKSNELQTEIN